MKEWRNHLPGFQGKKIVIIPLTALCSVLGTWTFYYILDNLARWYPILSLVALEPWLPILGSIFALTCAYLLIYSIWYRRKMLLARDRVTAYEKAILHGFAGIAIIIATVIHLYDPLIWFPLNLVPLPAPANPLTTILASSIWDLLAQHTTVSTPLFQAILGAAVFVFGFLLLIRSVETFGFDYVTVVYLYYPEESKLIDHKIYSIVRNPIYGAAILMGLGGVFSRCSFYATIVWFLVALVFIIHIRLVEDKELVERFGDSFRDYQQQVPSLFVHPKNWGKLVLFLSGKWK